jgi:hypothetical protein
LSSVEKHSKAFVRSQSSAIFLAFHNKSHKRTQKFNLWNDNLAQFVEKSHIVFVLKMLWGAKRKQIHREQQQILFKKNLKG